MVAVRVIHIEPGSEIDRALSESEERPVVLEWHGRRLRIVDDVGDQEPKQDRVQERLRMIAGVWKGLDVETFEREILEEREQDSPGRPR